MAENSPKTFLDRVEEEARDATPLWQWAFFILLLMLPIAAGYGYAAWAERTVWRLHFDEYRVIVWAQVGVTLAMLAIGVMDIDKGWSRKLFRQPHHSDLPPGPFRLGSAFLRVIYRPWWGIPVIVATWILMFRLLAESDPAITVHRVFWDALEWFAWFFAAAFAGMGLVLLAGLFIRLWMRERGRPV